MPCVDVSRHESTIPHTLRRRGRADEDPTNRLFIVERGGFIRVLQPGSSTLTLFLDIHTKLVAGGEQGPSIPRLQPYSGEIMALDPSHAHSNLTISSTGDIIAQLAVDAGRKGTLTEMTLVRLIRRSISAT